MGLIRLVVTISKTSTGAQDYMQILSNGIGDEANIVLIADKIEIQDRRSPVAGAPRGKRRV